MVASDGDVSGDIVFVPLSLRHYVPYCEKRNRQSQMDCPGVLFTYRHRCFYLFHHEYVMDAAKLKTSPAPHSQICPKHQAFRCK